MKWAPVDPWGGFGGGRSANVLGMPPTPRQRILPIEQLNTEWRTLGRSARAVYALHHLAEHDADLAALVHGPGSGSPGSPPACPTPCDLIDHMRQATGSRGREEAAALIRLMLRESPLDPLIVRCLIQALLPGLLTIAARLRWGQGGDWDDGSDSSARPFRRRGWWSATGRARTDPTPCSISSRPSGAACADDFFGLGTCASNSCH